jgi:hypothetical protein
MELLATVNVNRIFLHEGGEVVMAGALATARGITVRGHRLKVHQIIASQPAGSHDFLGQADKLGLSYLRGQVQQALFLAPGIFQETQAFSDALSSHLPGFDLAWLVEVIFFECVGSIVVSGIARD